jgi:hypothetical protein
MPVVTAKPRMKNCTTLAALTTALALVSVTEATGRVHTVRSGKGTDMIVNGLIKSVKCSVQRPSSFASTQVHLLLGRADARWQNAPVVSCLGIEKGDDMLMNIP